MDFDFTSSDLVYRYGSDSDNEVSDAEEGHETHDGIFIRWAPKIRREMTSSPKGVCGAKVILICLGPESCYFADTNILFDQPTVVAGLAVSTLEPMPFDKAASTGTLSQTAVSDRVNYIYQLKRRPDWLVLQCRNLPSSRWAGPFARKLFGSALDPYSIQVFLMTSYSGAYVNVSGGRRPKRSEEETPVFSLSSTSCRLDLPGRMLPPPNFLSGPAAEILAYCEVGGIKCQALVCGVEASSPEFSASAVAAALRNCFFEPELLVAAEKASAAYKTVGLCAAPTAKQHVDSLSSDIYL